MAAAVSGTIKRIVSDKGFGFVAAEDGTEYFFHNSACEGTRFDELREGQKVTFEKGQGPKGPRAENIRHVVARHSIDGCLVASAAAFERAAPVGRPSIET